MKKSSASLVTGDDFIARLLRHLKAAVKNAAQPVSVQLNPPCLRYLIEKLRDLDQQYSAGLRPSLGASIFSELFPDHSKLAELHQLLCRVSVFQLQPVPAAYTPTGPIRFDIFPALETLELHGMLALPGCEKLPQLRQQLSALVLSQCGYDLMEQLSLAADPEQDAQQQACDGSDTHIKLGDICHSCACWSSLRVLQINRCGLLGLGHVLQLLPSVEIIDLSRNAIIEIEDYNCCYGLRALDLSHNRIRECENIHIKLGNLETLSLECNHLLACGDLHRLKPLKQLNLSGNLLPQLQQVAKLQQLPLLQRLQLNDNPLTQLPKFRVTLARCFVGREPPLTLDGKPFTARELDQAIKVDVPVFPHARQRTMSEPPNPAISPKLSSSPAKHPEHAAAAEDAEGAQTTRFSTDCITDLQKLKAQHGDQYLQYMQQLMDERQFFQSHDTPGANSSIVPQESPTFSSADPVVVHRHIEHVKRRFTESVVEKP